jgi:hypothetical protein
MIAKNVIFLHNCTNSAKGLRDSCGEPNPTSHDASQAINIKVEEVSGAEEEAGPVPISFPKIKTEPEVRCMCLCPLQEVKLLLHHAVEVYRTVRS